MELLKRIQSLCQAYGPSGSEGEVRELITRLAVPYADSVSTDPMGNLIVHKRGEGPRLMLCAHLDSIGFVVTHIDTKGFLRVGRIGGIAPQEMLYAPVRFSNGICGVVAKEEKVDFEKLNGDDCYLDIGADSQEHARSMVQLGDVAIYDVPLRTSGHKVISPYMDNRVSCGILLQVLENIKACPNDLYLVFSTQEEVGLRGAKTAAYAIDPDYALVVDVTDVDDTPGSEKMGTVQLGKGAAIKVMDRSILCHPTVVAQLNCLAQEQNIPVQADLMRGGGTDAGAIHTTRLGVLTGGVSVPCRYIHTPTEMVDLRDVHACVQLLTAYVEQPIPSVKN